MNNSVQLAHTIITLKAYNTVLMHSTGTITARASVKGVCLNKNETW